MSNQELKLCPCGEPAEVDMSRGFRAMNGELGNAVAIYCSRCPFDMSLCYDDYPGDPPETLFFHLAKAWNTRANEKGPNENRPGT